MKPRKMTAEQLLAELEANPEYRAARARADRDRRRRADRCEKSLSPVVADLRSAGCSAKSVSDLMAPPYPSNAPEPNAIPILLDHIQRYYPADAREMIARALAVPEARTGWSVLVAQYLAETDPLAKDGLAAALDATATDETFEDLVALVRNRSNGPSRVILLSAIERSSDDRAPSVLDMLRGDADVAQEVAAIFGRLMQRARRRDRPRTSP